MLLVTTDYIAGKELEMLGLVKVTQVCHYLGVSRPEAVCSHCIIFSLGIHCNLLRTGGSLQLPAVNLLQSLRAFPLANPWW